MVLNGERMHYIAVKNLPALLRLVTSKHNGGYYCWSSLHSFRQKKLKSDKKVYENRFLEGCD